MGNWSLPPKPTLFHVVAPITPLSHSFTKNKYVEQKKIEPILILVFISTDLFKKVCAFP